MFSLSTPYSILCALTPCLIYMFITRKQTSKKIKILIVIFTLYLWQVYNVTGIGGLSDLLYIPDGSEKKIIMATINISPLINIGKDFILNIIMFIPFGYLVPFIWKNYQKLFKTIVLSFSFSLLIELSQLITTRAVDINDLIANTLGGIIGYTIWKLNPLKLKNASKKSPIIYIILSFLGIFFLYYPFNFYKIIGC